MSAASNKSKAGRNRASSIKNTNRIIHQKFKAILSRLQAKGAFAQSTKTNHFSSATYGSANQKVANS